MQQFGACSFNTVVRWHKLGEMSIERDPHNSFVVHGHLHVKNIKFSGDFTTF